MTPEKTPADRLAEALDRILDIGGLTHESLSQGRDALVDYRMSKLDAKAAITRERKYTIGPWPENPLSALCLLILILIGGAVIGVIYAIIIVLAIIFVVIFVACEKIAATWRSFNRACSTFLENAS